MAFLINGIGDKNVKSLYPAKVYPINMAEFVISNLNQPSNVSGNITADFAALKYDVSEHPDNPMIIFAASSSSTLPFSSKSEITTLRLTLTNKCSFSINLHYIDIGGYITGDDGSCDIISTDCYSSLGLVESNAAFPKVFISHVVGSSISPGYSGTLRLVASMLFSVV